MCMVDLHCGDCLILMQEIPDQSLDMILCDLPYGVTAKNHWDSVIPFEPLWEQYRRIIKPNGCIALFAQGMFMSKLMMSASDIWRYNLIWQKTSPTGFLNANRMPLRSHEEICIFYKKLPTYNPQKLSGQPRKVSTAHHHKDSKKSTDYGDYNFSTYDSTERYPTSVLTFASDKQKCALHPTQKPVSLCEYLIKTYTNEGDIVLDNCMGSGTTGIAAQNLNRNFIGIELDKSYYQIALERILITNINKTCRSKCVLICPYCHIEMNSRLKTNYSFIQHIKIENLGKITPITVTVPQAQIHSCTQCKYCAIESLNSEGLTSTDTLMTIEIPDEYEDVYAP